MNLKAIVGTLVVAALSLAPAGDSCAAQPPASATAPANAPATRPAFLTQWIDFYRQDWRPVTPPAPSPAAPLAPVSAAAAPARRGLPSPLDSPPFPSSDWSYGGSPVIGEPDTNSYPLMSAIDGSLRGGRPSRTKIYGWIEPSGNASTSSKSNAPEADDNIPNRVELNQAVLYVERLPETVQQAHWDWGFHLTALYGTDYRFTTGKGYFSGQLLDHNREYGFDPTLEYVDLYLPHGGFLHVGQGLNLRIGRFISVPGIEAQLTPYNYIFSHSLLYSVDPFTDTGIMATLKLSDQWLVQLGLTAGHDVALWTRDAQPSGTACLNYTTRSVNDNVYLCANGINTARYAYNNMQQFDGTWYHRFSKTVHTATESYFMYERDVPAIGGPIVPEQGANGAFCRSGETRCTAPTWAVVNYVQKELSPHDFVSFRSDFLADKKGQRTGYQTKYSENTLMLSHWVGTTIQIRPELRFERAWDRKSYDLGQRQNQLTFASDLIVHF